MNVTSIKNKSKKTLSKLGIEGNFLNLLKGMCEEPIANIIDIHVNLCDLIKAKPS